MGRHVLPNLVTFRDRYSVAEGLIEEILLIMNLVFNNNLFGKIVVSETVPHAAPAAVSLQISSV